MTNRLASDAIPPNGGSPTIARSESTRQSRLTQAIDEFYATIDAGHAVDRARLLEKYADVADELGECLANLDFIAEIAPQLASRNAPPASARLSSPQASLGSAELAASQSPASAALGDYRLVRELGRGGMGVVYEAEQLSLGRRVALKVLPFAAMLDKQQLTRFKNEARAAATLDHPNIVAIYSVGSERGVHYYAMQLIEGLTLAQVIEQARDKHVSSGQGPGANESPSIAKTAAFTPQSKIQNPKSKIDTRPVAALSTLPDFNSRDYYRSVARLGIQAAEALDHAHQNGVLHRDVKPGNLMVDDAGKLWITDFGLARIEADAGMTMTGDLVGTLRYMSPEQALAKRVVVDHRSDIYSLGVTLYELLTLRPAFTGNDRHELLRQIAFDDPRKPRQTNARIPQDLETIVLKAIEKNPTDRYASAQDLSDDLQRFVDDQTIRAKRPSPLAITFKWSRRHRVLVAAAAIILVLVTVGSIFSTALLFWERERTARANAQSQAVIKFLVNDLLTAPLDEDKLEREVTVSDVLANADAKIEQALAHQPRVEAFVRTTMAQTYNQLRKYEQAERQAQLARSLAASQYDIDDNGLYGATYELATALAEQLKLDEARRACDELVEAYRRDFGEEHARTIQATNLLIDVRLGTAEYGLNDTADHLQLCRDQLDQCRRVLGPEHPMTLAAMDNLGSCFRILDRHQEAQAVSQQALKTAQRTLAPDDKLMKTLKMGAALDLRRSGRYDEAANLIEDILNANRRTYGPRNPATMRTIAWLAKTNVERGRFDEAVELYQELFDSSRAMFNVDHASTIEAKYCLAYGLRYQGNYEAALELTQDVLSWRQQNLGPTHPNTFISMRDAARLLARLGRLDEARDMIDQEIAILPAEERAEREYLAWLLATYPVDGIRDGKRAVKLATQACEMIGYKESSPIDTLAGAYAEAGDFNAAIKWERKALEVATQAVSRAKYTRHLESYKNRKPWREE